MTSTDRAGTDAAGTDAAGTAAAGTARSTARAADRRLLRRTVGLFSPYKGRLALIGVLIVVAAGLGVIPALLVRQVIDDALFGPGGVDRPLLLRLVGLMVGIPIAASLLGLYQAYLTNIVGQRVMQDLRERLYRHLQSLSLRFFTATRTGDIQSRLANDVGGLQSVVTDTASTLLSNSVIILSTVVAMALLSWPLTVLSLVTLPLFAVLTSRVGRKRRQVAKQTQGALADMSATTEETLSVSGVLLSKVFGRQQSESGRYAEQNARLAGLQVRQEMIGRAFFAVVSTFFTVTPALVYLVAGYAPGITAGTLVAFTTLQTRLFFPIGQLLQTATEVTRSLALFERIFAYLDERADIVEPARPVALPTPVAGRVDLDDVWFTYGTDGAPPGASEDTTAGAVVQGDASPGGTATDHGAGAAPTEPRWALQGMSLDIAPGTLAAFVGASGSGKTTTSYLIPRLYDVTRGTVRLDGVDVRELSLATVTDAVGMVTQESYLFHASIRDNLAYSRPEATDAEIESAARAAQIHDRIMDFPEGYATVVGERGYRLSGGEKQRLAIARVILKDPRILVLDEATSALDTRNERLVQQALDPLMAGRTTIAIAHRLSTIRAADVIYVLDGGRVVEQGTHVELLARGGAYAALYDEQFAGGLVEARCADGMVLSDGHVLAMAGDGSPG